MATLCRPEVAVPEYVVTAEETLDLARTLHAGHPQLGLALRLIANTGVRTRHLVRPLEETLRHPGFEERNLTYEKEAKRRLPQVVEAALAHAELTAADIGLLVYVSCTGFMMPSMTAHLINTMGLRSDTRQLPVSQLGCAAGGAAVNRAHDFLTAYPHSNALIVACEFCSLLYQPDDLGVGSLLSNGLFGDAMAAVVVRGEGGHGIRLEHNGSHLVPGTEDWISYAVRDTGFHFRLDKRVPGTMEVLAPALREMAGPHGWDVGALDFYLVHAGGPRILDDLGRHLGLPPTTFRHSRATLTERGNIASAVVFDALARLFAEGGAKPGGRGLLAGFGPGITAEISLGHWTAPAPPAPAAAPAAGLLPAPRAEAPREAVRDGEGRARELTPRA
ncbi:type III polyketide synthase [Streptomyces sp. NBC_00249]|uniref:type III polyketide synthase n=1 Tax=Streptomyces sp. NBC_00249 TaxID=2975690 RepID=UPI0022563767|nr:type III polyketide synthase [Streptomyces sp. NBC_00249]MCX5196153.1 type III polyketide synthase [Streptomyces sp. NBC_00249]